MSLRNVILAMFATLWSLTAFATTPQVTSTSPTTGPTGSQVQINGSGFGGTQGIVKFNGSYPATIITWSDTQIVAKVPDQAFTGALLVTAGGVNSNQTVYFNVPAPQITSISPTNGVVGTQVTINGSGFQTTKGANSSVSFNGTNVTVSTWGDTQILATVPTNATSGAVKVVVNGIGSNQDQVFTMPNPIVSGLSPSSAPVGSLLHINGSGFGATQGSSTAQINGTNGAINFPITNWTDTTLTGTVPTTAVSGPISVTIGGVVSPITVNFTISPPQVASISPITGLAGTTQITVTGSGFQANKGTSSTLQINGTTATTSNWTDTQIVATVPSGTSTGPVKVTVNNIISNQDVIFTVPNPIVTSISPSSGLAGTQQVTVSGTGFGVTKGTSTLSFAGIVATTTTWTDTQIVGTVPASATTGYIQVTVAGVSSHPGDVYFTVPGPQISSITPSSGAPGTSVTVNGSGFRSTQMVNGVNSSITFNGVGATVIPPWSDTQIVATVPASATTGSVKVSGSMGTSNADLLFTMANPIVASISPSTGSVGTALQINGSGFGSAGTVKIGGIAATIVPPWSDSQITTSIPVTAKSGAVVVTTNGVSSNSNINFTVPAPQITSINPSSGIIGGQVTINGTGFQSPQPSSSSLTFASGGAWTVVTWSDTQIVAKPAVVGGTNPVQVTVNGVVSNNDVEFTLPNPLVSGISPLGGPTGTSVQITGSGFGATQGTSTLTFNFVNATNVVWTDTLITATVAPSTTTGAVRLTVGGIPVTGATFSVSSLFVNSVSPAAGSVNTPVTITGSGFGSSRGTNTVSFNSISASTYSTWTDTQIVANVPTGATTGGVKVTVGGTASNTSTIFTVSPVVVTSVSPASGLPGSSFQINGSGFGSTVGSSSVMINGWTAASTNWSDTQITANVPAGTTGPVKVTVGANASNTTVNFAVLGPVITGISPSSGPVLNTVVQITGSGFGATRGTSNFSFNGTVATDVRNWTDTSISLAVPATATTGRVWVAEGSVFSNSNLNFTVPSPKITSITPSNGVVGTTVTINGSGFRSSAGGGSNSLTFNGVIASTAPWSDTQITATVPQGAKTGPIQITGGVTSNQDVLFSMPNPVVSSAPPTNGPTGTQIQIAGSGFGATQNGSTATINGKPLDNIVWTDTLITGNVPSNGTSGPIVITEGGVSSNSSIVFTVPAPHITGISPNTGLANQQITITGTNFQAAAGTNNFFDLTNVVGGFAAALIVTWSDTQIVATVPANTLTGPAWVSVNGVNSNKDVEFTLITPKVTGLAPTNGPVGTQVQISGSGFGSSQGSSTVQVGGKVALVSTWSDSQILATVPSTAKSGSVVVLVAGVGSNNNINFTVPTPRITGITPASGSVGTIVTINGSGFQSARGTGSIVMGGHPSASPNVFNSWTDSQIVFVVPPGAISGAIQVVTNNSDTSNQDAVFTAPNPTISGLAPASGPTGTQVQINGAGFGATQSDSAISFNSIAASVVSWSDTQVVATVPPTATSGAVQVTNGGVNSNASVYFNVPIPTITNISPAIAGVENPITINGTGFQTIRGTNSNVSFSSGGTATIKSWSDTQIVAVAPQATTTGFLDVSVNNIPSNYVDYAVPSQTISSLNPATGPVGTPVTITGTAFGGSQGTSVLSFNGQPAAVSNWTNTQIVATVPVTAASGPAVVTVGGVNSNTSLFTVPGPSVNNMQPNGAVSGTQVTINGSGFQTNQRDSSLTFNGTPAAITTWSDTQIVANVPTGATTGPLLVTVNSVPSQNSAQFEVPNPTITSISPPEAPAGGTVTITGSGFGASDRYSPDGVSTIFVGFINFNGVTVGALSWSNNSITVTVPSNGTSGPVTITKYNATSNGSPLTVEGAPTVAGLSPTIGPVGQTVVISGSGFGSAQRSSAVQFYGTPASVSAWSDTQITASVPPGAATGPVSVIVAGVTGPSSTFTLNSTVQITDSFGHVTSYTFDQLGGRWHNSFSTGSGCSSCTVRGVLNKSHDTKGNLLTSSDELSHTTTFTYDSDNQVLSTSTPLDSNTNVTTSYTYNGFGEPLTVTDPLGNVTINTYDANGNLLTVTSPVPATGVAASVTQFAYDAKGELTQITDPLSHSTTLAYYPTGLIHTITDAQSNVTSYEYDSRGNRTAVVDAQQNRTVFAYDAANRLTGITYPDSTTVSFAYDSRGRRTSVTDQNGKVTSYVYDDADRLTSVTDAALNITTYAYDLENNLTGITDAAGHTTLFVYDAFGRVTQTAFPSSLTENYVYDAIGNLTSKTDRKNQTILYVYDALNRLSHKGYPDATGVDYVYDLAGKIKQVADPTGTYGFAYDNMGRLIGTTTQYSFLPGQTYTNSYTYDAASNRTGFTAPDGSTNTYAYDTLNRLSALTDSGAGQFTMGYDALSRRTQLTRPNGVTTSYGYDPVSHLQSILHKLGVNTLDGATYAYDLAGNRTSKTNQLNSTVSNYGYDNIYQLTGVTQGATTTETFTFDPVGNRLSSLSIPSYSYNSSNEVTATGSPSTYTYDNNGNILTKIEGTGTTTYTWDFKNRLTSVHSPGQTTVTFKYDPFGRRIQKGGSVYLYEGVSLIAEADGIGNLAARYIFGSGIDEPLAVYHNATWEFYQADGLGSITSLSTTTGTISDSFVYDSFGNVTSSTGSFSQPFRYTGREWDIETGLYYYRARYYDPQIGRFVNEDPIEFGGGINVYRYVKNNPIKHIDPTGLIHQAWNESPWDGRLHDDPGAGLEVLCTKGRNIQQDIQWLEHSVQVRSAEIVRLGEDADIGHIDRLESEFDALIRCQNECEKDKKPEPDKHPFKIPDEWLNWMEDQWEELKYQVKHPRQFPPIGPGPAPMPIPIPIPI